VNLVQSWEPDDLELRLCADLLDEPGQSRRREAAVASVLLHVAVVAGLVTYVHFAPPPPAPVRARQDHVTLVYPPLLELTQKEPNVRPPSKLFLGAKEALRPPRLLMPFASPGQPLVAKDKGNPRVLEEKPPQLVPRPEPSGTQLAQLTTPSMSAPVPPAPPKLVLEDARRPLPGGRPGQQQPGLLDPQRPGSVIEGAVRDLAHNPGLGGTVVGDGDLGGIPGGFTNPSRGNAGSNLELLSDPMGVDFKPYLTRILAMVRRNWFAVIPESARLGVARGRVTIQLLVLRQGSVGKLVIAGSSGVEPLDRAAVAGISASNPFPPLPAEFRGDSVRLQFTFLYNVAAR
jgi:TonB family protein